MNRITPEQVLKAYQQTGCVPVQRMYQGDQGRACALTAMLQSANDYLPHVSDIVSSFADQFGYDGRYVFWFIQGWDSTGITGSEEPGQLGYQDGRAAWEYVSEALA